jgi:hypothetical protein
MAPTRQELVLSFMQALATNPELLNPSVSKAPERIINMAGALADEYLKSLG